MVCEGTMNPSMDMKTKWLINNDRLNLEYMEPDMTVWLSNYTQGRKRDNKNVRLKWVVISL
jgi:hypothetical protein